jgi:hypothetical protein
MQGDPEQSFGIFGRNRVFKFGPGNAFQSALYGQPGIFAFGADPDYSVGIDRQIALFHNSGLAAWQKKFRFYEKFSFYFYHLSYFWVKIVIKIK